MEAMVLARPGQPLERQRRPTPDPRGADILVEVAACGVCRTDLHVVDGDLPPHAGPIVPGHEIVGRVAALGPEASGFALGDRVGVPWLGGTCGHCPYCAMHRENLCDTPAFTGYTRDGGFATHTLADSRYVFPLPDGIDDLHAAPLLCAGLIGFRAYRFAGEAAALGLYGFGASAHILAQLAIQDGRAVYAFSRPGDTRSQDFARSLGVAWAGGSDEAPPRLLDAAILFAPVGSLVPEALRHIRKGGRVVCAGIHMSDIPSFPYADLWGEREIVSVANLTRADGTDFFARLARRGVETSVTPYPLGEANTALDDLRHGRFDGAAVLVPEA